MKTTLRDLLNIVFQFGRVLLVFWVIAALAIVIYYTQTARHYDSKARILVSLGAESSGRADYLNNRNMQLILREQQIHDEQQILLSEHVMLTTAKWILGEPTPDGPPPAVDPQLVEQARRFLTGEEPEPTLLLKFVALLGKASKKISEALPFSHGAPIPEANTLATKLAKSLDAKPIFDSDALDVSFRYRDPRVAQTVLKLILAAYMEHHIAVFQSGGESTLLKSELDHSVAQYQQKLDQMAQFMATHKVFTEDSQINSLITQREQISQTLGEAVADSQASAARIHIFDGLNGSLKKYEVYSTTEIRNKTRQELETRLNEAQVQEQQILNNHPPESQASKDQVEVLRRIRELMKEQPAQVVDQTEDRRSGASELAEQQLITATAAQKSAQARADQLRHQLADVNQALLAYSNSIPGYNLMKLNLDFSKQQSEQMGQAYVNSRLRVLTAQNQITDVAIIDTPSWEPDVSSPKKSLVAVLALAVLLIGGVAVLLTAQGLDQTLSNRHATEAALGVPVAAVLPLIRHDADDPPMLLQAQTENEFARVYTSVRAVPTPGVVILLAGCNGGEGLSLIGYELARFLGRNAGLRTALLDCTVHPVSPESRMANGPTVLSLPLVTSSPLASGSEVSGLPEPRMAELLTKWRSEFAYIVISSSVAKDIYKLVDVFPAVDSAFLVLQAGRTRRATAASRLDLLRSYGLQDIQLILNKRRFYIPEWLVRFI